MSVLREFYLSLCFLVGMGAILAPFFGIALPVFTYNTAQGKGIDLPVSVSVYAMLLLVSIAILVLRLLKKSDTDGVGNAQ